MATPEDILTAPTFEEIPADEPVAPPADDGIMNDLLSGGSNSDEEKLKLLMQQMMVQQLLQQAAATQAGAATATRGTNVDALGALSDPNSPFRNPEYGPSSNGVKYLFMGGSPYPMPAAQERAAENYAKTAMVSNILDSLVNTPQLKQQKQGQPIVDLIGSLFNRGK